MSLIYYNSEVMQSNSEIQFLVVYFSFHNSLKYILV
jgi:hypothetical protein